MRFAASEAGAIVGQCPKRSTERRQHLLRMAEIEKVYQRAVLSFDQANLQLLQETADREPKVIPNREEALNVLSVALPNRVDEHAIALVRLGMEPLLKLVEDDEHFAALVKPLATPQESDALRQVQVLGSPGQRFRSVFSSRASVSSVVAST